MIVSCYLQEYDEEGGLTPYGTPLGTTPKKKDGGSDKRHSGDGGKRQSSLVTATKPKKRCLEREYPSSCSSIFVIQDKYLVSLLLSLSRSTLVSFHEL